MVYGILLESIVQHFILEKYDRILLQQVEEYVQCRLSHLNLFDLYDDHIMIAIAEGMSSVAAQRAITSSRKPLAIEIISLMERKSI